MNQKDYLSMSGFYSKLEATPIFVKWTLLQLHQQLLSLPHILFCFSCLVLFYFDLFSFPLYISSNFNLIFVSSLFFIFLHFFLNFLCIYFYSFCQNFVAGEMLEPKEKPRNFRNANFRTV